MAGHLRAAILPVLRVARRAIRRLRVAASLMPDFEVAKLELRNANKIIQV